MVLNSLQIFFLIRHRVLRISSGLGEPGAVNWDLALCLLLAWIMCYLCVCKGIKSSGKVSCYREYFTVGVAWLVNFKCSNTCELINFVPLFFLHNYIREPPLLGQIDAKLLEMIT